MSEDESSIKKLQDNYDAILFIELAGLLHDIGKLSKDFLKYRQDWHDDSDGYTKDPHDHRYFDKDTILHKKEYYALLCLFNKEIPKGAIFGDATFTIKSAVHNHTDLAARKIEKMLKAADSIDAAFDRNNPLWSAEQRKDIYDSDVFGFEGRRVNIDEQDNLREDLYKYLASSLQEYFKKFKCEERKGILEAIREKFDQGLSDTTRPQNDTTLWEHGYAVASILKSLTVHNLFSDESNQIEDFRDVRFGILGVGWDGMRFMTYGQKISDILGRKAVIDKIKAGIKDLIEYKFPIGNEIYADDNGIYFIVPAELEKKPLLDVWAALKDGIYRMAANESFGELQPVIKLHSPEREYTDSKNQQVKNKGVRTLTALVTVIQDLEHERAYPYDATREDFHYFAQELRRNIRDARSVCPICRFRPVQSEDRTRKICLECEKRRRRASESLKKNEEEKSSKEGEKKETPTVYIDEIKDKNSQAALIVARFGLDEWVNGKMVRSLFVTEAHDIEEAIKYLPQVKQFEAEETVIKTWFTQHGGCEYTYQRIKDDVDALYQDTDPDRAKHVRFLYDLCAPFEGGRFTLIADLSKAKSRLHQLWQDAKSEHSTINIYNVVNAKTPTPSTILDVWDTTTRFFKDFKKGIIEDERLLPEANRLCLFVEETMEEDHGARDAEVEGLGRVEIIVFGANQLEVIGERYTEESKNKLTGKKIRILDGRNKGEKTIADCAEGTSFRPYRDITLSPNLFMAFVPADRALEITKRMYKQYIERFGKVMGRLPFSIGNIFFKKKMPIFVVLDAAKRMIANFDKLAKTDQSFTATANAVEESGVMHIPLQGTLGGLPRSVDWRLPCKLGDNEPDFYHPYLIVDGSPNRKTFFETVAGNVVHFSDIKENDRLKLYLNYYDYEFLEANARRYDVSAESTGRRTSSVGAYESKPYLLDELTTRIIPLWKNLLEGRQLPGITDTKLRNMQSLWLTKYAEWNVKLEKTGKENYRQWLNLITSTIGKEFPKIKNEQKALLEETVKNGVFFDALEIYLGIMKEKIGQ